MKYDHDDDVDDDDVGVDDDDGRSRSRRCRLFASFDVDQTISIHGKGNSFFGVYVHWHMIINCRTRTESHTSFPQTLFFHLYISITFQPIYT